MTVSSCGSRLQSSKEKQEIGKFVDLKRRTGAKASSPFCLWIGRDAFFVVNFG
jgi:hypothetical protein